MQYTALGSKYLHEEVFHPKHRTVGFPYYTRVQVPAGRGARSQTLSATMAFESLGLDPRIWELGTLRDRLLAWVAAKPLRAVGGPTGDTELCSKLLMRVCSSLEGYQTLQNGL